MSSVFSIIAVGKESEGSVRSNQFEIIVGAGIMRNGGVQEQRTSNYFHFQFSIQDFSVTGIARDDGRTKAS
jgi:hypothetical protein